jgi:hypothetical protein
VSETATPEAAVAALFTRLTNSGDYTTVGRRNRDPENISPDNTPMLMLLEHSDTFLRPSKSLPEIHKINLRAVIYTDVGDDDNAVPSITLNNLLQKMKDDLKPDDPMRNSCTLNGLVDSVMIDGDTVRSPGDTTGKSLVIVPIVITL